MHDRVFVARTAGTPAAVPNPTGSVVFHRYPTINCTGTAVNQTVALTAGNPSVADSDTFAATADMSYQAEYLGDANYPARTGACEPLTVTPVPQPAIAIVKNPKSQTVLVGATATFTITVTNTGNVTLTDVNVVDPLSPLCNRTKADIPALASMAPAATVTYTCTRPNVRAAFDNVATATGTPPTGPNVTASDTAPVKTRRDQEEGREEEAEGRLTQETEGHRLTHKSIEAARLGRPSRPPQPSLWRRWDLDKARNLSKVPPGNVLIEVGRGSEMGRIVGWRALLLCGVASVFMVFGVSGALADDFHGIAFAKQCTSPVQVGDPYTCSLQILNVVDIPAHDTLRVTGFSDNVHSAGGDVTTGNIMPTTGLVFTGAVACTGGTGTGTSGDPYIGATECLLPFGTSMQTKPFSHYTVQANDFNLPNHQLTDTATLNWNDTCNSGSPNCTTDAQTNTAGSSALVEKLASATATDIHNAAHQVVTAVAVGSTVHDFVTVTGQPGLQVPTGNVNIDWFLNNTCTGQPVSNSGSVGPLANGQFDATAFAFTVNAPSGRAFRAHYEGDTTYLPSDGPCEPLAVVDANIQISPNGVNRVGQSHVFTAHVNVNGGTGFVNAPDGTQISFTIDSGPGAFTTTNPCTTAGGTGSCSITLSSAVTGVTTVSAHTTVAVGSVTLTRNTDGTRGEFGSGDEDVRECEDRHRSERDERGRGAAFLRRHADEGHGHRNLRACRG